MKRETAKQLAQEDANKHRLTLALVAEGPHADEFADRDTDGESYGFCKVGVVSMLYKYGRVVEIVKPEGMR